MPLWDSEVTGESGAVYNTVKINGVDRLKGDEEMSHWDKNINRESRRVAVMEESLEPVFCSKPAINDSIKLCESQDTGCINISSDGHRRDNIIVWDKGNIQRD